MNYLFRQTYEVLQNLIDYIENWVYNKIGVAGGLATLNEDGKVPSEQIDLESIVPAMTQEEASAGVEEAQRTISPEVLATAVDEKVSPLDERVSAAEGNIQTLDETADDLNERLETVEQLAEISIGGGDIGIATAADFDNPTPEQRAKVPTVGAVLDCMDVKPTPGSVKPVQSGGVYDAIQDIQQQIDGKFGYTYSSGFIAYSNGVRQNSSVNFATGYIDIEGFDKIIYTRVSSTNTASVMGMAFYDGSNSKTYISGQKCENNTTGNKYVKTELAVPTNAKYARFTILEELPIEDFYVKKEGSILELVDNSVSYTAQSKTNEEKEVARTNIDAANKYDTYYGEELDLSQYEESRYLITQNNVWQYTTSTSRSKIIPITPSLKYRLTTELATVFAVLSSDDVSENPPSFCVGYESRLSLPAGGKYNFEAPADARFLYILVKSSVGVTNTLCYSLTKVDNAIKEIDDSVKLLKSLTYRYVTSRGTTYRKTTNYMYVTLNTITLNDGASSTISITDETEYRLGTSARFLIYDTLDSSIKTKQTSASLKATDVLLLYYDDNSANKDIVAGLLYPDYIKKQLYDIQDEIDFSRDDTPESTGVLNALKKGYQQANLKWTPVNNTMPWNGGIFVQGNEYKGMVYSSAKEYSQFVMEDVSLETFMTAVHNPRSVLYTENISASQSRSSLGRVYNGVNCACYYGSVCSGLLTFAYGLPMNVTTYEFSTWEEMELVKDQSAYGAKLADCLWTDGHVKMVSKITRDEKGFITNIQTFENAGPTTKTLNYTVDSFNNLLGNGGYTIFRYKKLYENNKYVPMTEFVTVFDETPSVYEYNDDICPNYGNKSNYNEGDNVVLNLRTDYASAGFTTIEIYKDNTLLVSRAITGIDETFTSLTYGDYKARLTGNGVTSEYCYFKVVNASVSRSGNSFIFGSDNATPVYYEFCDLQGRRSYDIIGLSTRLFTPEELENGEATPYGDVVPSGNYKYLKVHFETDYGRVIKVVRWS